MKRFLSAYCPLLILFVASLVVALLTYQDYGVAWDEPLQRAEGLLSYNYLAQGNQDLFTTPNDYHGAGFEILLLAIEKGMHIEDMRDVYLMRHLVSHIFFLLGAVALYSLIYRLFNNKLLAVIGFLMLVLMPRIYAHSFFNSKDVPFMVMFIFAFAVARSAFASGKLLLFLLLGIICGYATGIRLMGGMLYGMLTLFLILDMVIFRDQGNLFRQIARFVLFTLGFCAMLYVSWPYLHRAPLQTFVESYRALSHFKWGGRVLFQGKLFDGANLPLTYLPVWFAITTPVVWLVTGIAGTFLIAIKCLRTPLLFLENTPQRNFLLYIVCFVVPVASVVLLHSVIYDDWRHLYFIYPAFIMASLYITNVVLQTRYGKIALSAVALQAIFLLYFMIDAHPFQQVYFNRLVSHKKEYLRNNFDLEYWGCSYKQALEFLLAYDHSDTIKVAWAMDPLFNNTLMLKKEDRPRITLPERPDATYQITNFRLEPVDLPYPVVFSIKRLNSTILCVYKLR